MHPFSEQQRHRAAAPRPREPWWRSLPLCRVPPVGGVSDKATLERLLAAAPRLRLLECDASLSGEDAEARCRACYVSRSSRPCAC